MFAYAVFWRLLPPAAYRQLNQTSAQVSINANLTARNTEHSAFSVCYWIKLSCAPDGISRRTMCLGRTVRFSKPRGFQLQVMRRFLQRHLSLWFLCNFGLRFYSLNFRLPV
jgi:hypothetical protein